MLAPPHPWGSDAVADLERQLANLRRGMSAVACHELRASLELAVAGLERRLAEVRGRGPA